MTRDTTLISVNPRLRRLYKRLANHLVPTSRDLALEAFEDGHPHILYI